VLQPRTGHLTCLDEDNESTATTVSLAPPASAQKQATASRLYWQWPLCYAL